MHTALRITPPQGGMAFAPMLIPCCRTARAGVTWRPHHSRNIPPCCSTPASTPDQTRWRRPRLECSSVVWGRVQAGVGIGSGTAPRSCGCGCVSAFIVYSFPHCSVPLSLISPSLTSPSLISLLPAPLPAPLPPPFLPKLLQRFGGDVWPRLKSIMGWDPAATVSQVCSEDISPPMPKPTAATSRCYRFLPLPACQPRSTPRFIMLAGHTA